MRIALVVDCHSENMAYPDSFLPKALASLGHEVHLITSNGQVYFTSPVYKDIFEPFLGPGIVECGVNRRDGYTFHRLPHKVWRGKVHIKGLAQKLRILRPDIVQSGEIISLLTYEMALLKPFLGYKFFVECHTHASVFYPLSKRDYLYWFRHRIGIGRLVSLMAEKFFAISTDAADVAIRLLGAQKHKMVVRSLGVETSLFKPPIDEISRQKRLSLRTQLGFSDSDIVCVYTGRFSQGKGCLCLAQAIGKLVEQGKPFRGLFVGNGNQEYVKDILSYPGCVVHPFVAGVDLPLFYWAADIGVWPKQESVSQLDATACGLPIVLSNKVKVLERIDGNGLLYEENNADDLADKLVILSDVETRRRMGECGVKKIRERFSWDIIAKEFERDYKEALAGRK